MTKDKVTGQLEYEEMRRAAKLLVEARQARSKRERAERLREAQRLLRVSTTREPGESA
jgi:hypothetical protein